MRAQRKPPVQGYDWRARRYNPAYVREQLRLAVAFGKAYALTPAPLMVLPDEATAADVVA